MNNDKKNDIGIVLLIVILLILVVAMSIYIVVNKVGYNDTEKGNENTPNTSDEQQIKQEN